MKFDVTEPLAVATGLGTQSSRLLSLSTGARTSSRGRLRTQGRSLPLAVLCNEGAKMISDLRFKI